jgi:hypothetical protein
MCVMHHQVGTELLHPRARWCEGRRGWGDGPGLPGVPTGLPCQASAAAFIVAYALSMTLTIAACRLVATVQTSCLYWQPEHLPNKP